MFLRNLASPRTLLVATGLLLAACDEYPLHDLGYTGTEPSSSVPSEPDPGPPVAALQSEFAGVWVGEAEDPFALRSDAERDPPIYRLPSGSSHIWLRISVEDQITTGTLTFGDGLRCRPPKIPTWAIPRTRISCSGKAPTPRFGPRSKGSTTICRPSPLS